MALPALRDELTLHPGPVGADGAPNWTLHDPLRNQFFRIGWPAFEMLTRWHLGSPEGVAAAVTAETTLTVTAADVTGLADTLLRSQLARAGGPSETRRLFAIAQTSRPSWATWLLHHYLFFRIPLVRPDRLLDALLPSLRWLGGRGFRLATLAAVVMGLFLVGRQADVFAATLVDTLSPEGMATFAVALGLAKIVHEFAHGLTAKAQGCRVPTMGVAFLVLWPVLYTDVNEAWKLPDRRHRLLVGGAGILAELTLAVWATLAWALLPDGTPRAMAFTLAATTWISSLLVNLSPFMRFDGYFLVMDLLDMPNLHERSFALARWWLREMLFGLGERPPEPLSARRRAHLVAFALGVWAYRLTLFLGIAALVYGFFIKVVGVFLFAVEIGWFVIRPIVGEIAQWRVRSGRIVAGRRWRFAVGALGAVVLLLVVPWNGRVAAPAVAKAGEHAQVFAPQPSILAGVEVAEGQQVTAGTVLARLNNPAMDHRLAQAARRAEVLRYQLSAVSFDDSFRGRSQAIAKELETVQAELAAVQREKERLVLVASFDGVVVDVSPNLQPGQWIGTREPILAIRGGTVVLDALVGEDDLPRLVPGATATFIPEGSGSALTAVVESVDRTAVRALPEPSLASLFGGPIPARLDHQTAVADGAFYRVHLTVASPGATAAITLRGEAHIAAAPRSLLTRMLRSAAAVVIREMGT